MKSAPKCIRTHVYAPAWTHMQPSVPATNDSTRIMLQKENQDTEITQVTFLPMGYIQIFDVNPMAQNKSSQIQFIYIYIHIYIYMHIYLHMCLV